MGNVRPITLSKVQSGAPRPKLDYAVDYFGTIDTTSDPSLMEDNNSPDTLNTVFDQLKSVGSRKGYIKLLTTKLSSFIGGMFPLYQSTGTRQLIYAAGTHLYKYNNAGGSTVLNGTNGSPYNFTADQTWSFDEYLDTVYGGNGIDGLVAYNGSTVSISNSGITPRYVKTRTNRIYAANKNSSTLYFSDAGDPTSWPVNNFIQINTNDGQNITGLSTMIDNLVIFKDESVWVMTGEPLGAGNTTTIGNLQLRQCNSPVGCTSDRTIQFVDGVLYFMHYSGIYVLQNYSVGLVSPMLNFTFLNGMNTNYMNTCYALYNPNQKKYMLGYPSATSTTPDSMVVWDLLVKQYTLWDHMPGSCAVNFKFSGTQEQVLMGDPVQGNIYELFQGYADIAGYTNTSVGATGGSTTTLIDSAASWTTNEFVDCRVMIGSNLGNYQVVTVTSNTANTLTFTPALSSAVTAGTPYSIGYYTSYWKTKNHDFEATGYTKAYRYFNLFCDSEQYNILFGFSIDYAALNFQKAFNLGGGSLTWGEAGLNWGVDSGTWGTYTSVFGQANVGGAGRHIQVIFGNNLANQPWRAVRYSFQYKLKKERTNIVTI